ncbi:MAG: hypothetical protein VX988_02965, partial [Planctomycetota bacterium]|nr:hypothetical protein [Planctomycetota bacterium]
LLSQHIDSGRAMEQFQKMVSGQGGDLSVPRPVAPKSKLVAERSGYISAINTQQLGQVVVELGGGRRVKSDTIDHDVGLKMHVRIGDEIAAGRPLLDIFAKSAAAAAVRDKLAAAIRISDKPPMPLPLIVKD